MNMSWKKTEQPMNLIQILPTDGDKSQTKISQENVQLRIQVGGESSSVCIELLGKGIQVIREGFSHAGTYLQAWATVCRGTFVGTGTVLISSLRDVFVFLRKNASWSSKAFIRSSHGIHSYVHNLWLGMLRKKDLRSPFKVKAIAPTTELQAHVIPSTLERDELLWEVHAMHDQLTSQKNEITRVNVQISELKALALSQQQVLLHLGKELESSDSKQSKPEKASLKKSKFRSSKAGKSKPLSSASPTSPEAPMSLNPHHR